MLKKIIYKIILVDSENFEISTSTIFALTLKCYTDTWGVYLNQYALRLLARIISGAYPGCQKGGCPLENPILKNNNKLKKSTLILEKGDRLGSGAVSLGTPICIIYLLV